MWIFLVILSTVVYAVVVLLDRYIMGYRLANPSSYLVVGSIAGLLVSAVILVATHNSIEIHLPSLIGGISTGILYGIFTYLYFATLRDSSPVTTVTYMQILPVVTTLAAVYILHENIPDIGFISILLVIGGLACISIIDWRSPSIAAFRMLPAILVLSVAYILQRLLLNAYSPAQLLALNRIGNLLVSGAVITITRYKFQQDNSEIGLASMTASGWVAAVFGEIGSIGALYLILHAYDQGPFAEVSALAAILPVFVLIGSTILYKFWNWTFWQVRELQSLSTTILMFIGIAFIALAVLLLSKPTEGNYG